nr:hypothetical protein [uncultured Methanolobus sp.]
MDNQKMLKIFIPIFAVTIINIFAISVAQDNILLYFELLGSFIFGSLYISLYNYFVKRAKN